jgi:hypothetical protein
VIHAAVSIISAPLALRERRERQESVLVQEQEQPGLLEPQVLESVLP